MVDIVPPHFSYSSLSTYMKCGQQYFLQKIAHVPEIPSWWFVGGAAVHTLTEIYDLEQEKFQESGLDHLWQEVFNGEVEAQRTKHPDVSQWRTAGKKKNNPDGEDYLAWMDLGPKFVQNYIDWREGKFLWLTYDDMLSVELPLDFNIHGWRFKGAIDRVFVDDNGQDLVVVDLKTGSRMPESPFQLGTYAVGLEVQYGERPKYGKYFNLRTNKFSPTYNLSRYTIDSVGRMGVDFKEGIKNKVFLPHETTLCNYCPVNQGCAAFGGKDAHLYTIEKVLNG